MSHGMATSHSGATTLKWVFLGVALVIALGYGKCQYSAWSEKAEAEKKVAQQQRATTPPPVFTEALVLEHECLTPCSVNIAWRFQIRVGGSRALRIKYKGVSQPVDYPAGEGSFQAPSQMQSGETSFVSPDPLYPNVRVQVYRIIIVQK